MKIVDDTEAVDATAFFPDELYISLISSDDEQAQSVILDNWFLEKFRNYKPDKDSFKQICDTIIHQKGMITRSQLALQFNLSENYMHKLFVKKIGLSVKPFAQLVRISSILEDIYRGNHTGSIDILVKYGYYDQAHFIKDFKRITHQTPHQYFRNDTTLSALLAGIK